MFLGHAPRLGGGHFSPFQFGTAFTSMGMQHAVVKFYSSYDKKYDRDALLTAAVVFLALLFASLIFWWQYDAIVALVASTNPDMGRYAFMILLIAIATALFEISTIGYVQYTTVFGNFLKRILSPGFNWASHWGLCPRIY